MKIELSAPSKTFLTGEYAVLRGGPALVLNTSPRFVLTAVRGEGKVTDIPDGSPAALWLRQRAPVWRDWTIKFDDPHYGQGGFGASSAQFLTVHALTTFMQSSVSRVAQGYDLRALWNDFKALSGGKASGADVFAQNAGRVALVDVGRSLAAAREWPFEDIGFAIVRTGRKVPTHEHLRTLDQGKLEALVPLSHTCVETFRPGAGQEFLAAFKAYADKLTALELQAPETRELCEGLVAQPWCLAVKGCGALGADTAVVLYARKDRDMVLAAIPESLNETDLSGGLEMKWSWP